MTASDFAAWVAHMKTTHRWSASRCARELECSRNSVDAWIKNGAPRYIGLACMALACGLSEWPPRPVQP